MPESAVVTGGSKGIGFALAQELAKKGYDLLLIARSESELKAASDTLADKYKIKALYFAIDLSETNAPDKIVEFINKNTIPVSVLINNAGFALWGSFEELGFENQQKMLMVNVISLLKLTHLLLPGLKEKSQAYVLNVASTTGYQSMANFAVYAASKAFIISFSRALRYELRSTSVSVSCLSPGTTTSNFMDRAGMTTDRMRKQASKVTMDAATVAAFAISGMFRGKNEMIPGFVNWFSAVMTRFVPKSLTEKIAAALYKK